MGGLFQDRFRSEPVENDSYFLTVLRYIHRNPVKAGICETVAEYKESSYNEYIHPRPPQITDTDFVLSMLGKAQYIEYINENSLDKCLDMQEILKINDSEARVIIQEISKCSSTSEFQVLPSGGRNKFLAELKTRGLSVRQIERLTGINRGLVQKA